MNCPSCGHENIDGIDRCENCLAPFRQLDIPSADAAEGLARSVMEDNLGQLDSDNAICVAPDMPALEVARLMKNANTGCALVVQGDKLVGIFTEHDVLLRLTDNKVAYVNPESGALSTAARSREDRDNDRVSDAAMPVEMPLNEIPASDIPIEELRADAMPVADTPTSDTDTTRVTRAAPFDVPVKDLMSHNPETLHERDSVAEAVNKMSLGRYRHIPFVRSDGTYAVASIKSVLKYIAREDW